VGDGRAEGLSAIGDGRKAAISLTPNVVGIHIHILGIWLPCSVRMSLALYIGFLS